MQLAEESEKQLKTERRRALALLDKSIGEKLTAPVSYVARIRSLSDAELQRWAEKESPPDVQLLKLGQIVARWKAAVASVDAAQLAEHLTTIGVERIDPNDAKAVTAAFMALKITQRDHVFGRPEDESRKP